MSGLGSFGSSPSGSGMFGAKPPDQPTSGFNIPKATPVTTGTTKGPIFGTVSAGGLFGTQQQSSSQTAFGSGFGIKPTTSTTAPSNFTFGSSNFNKTLPTFGASPTVLPAFGTPSTSASAPFGALTTSTAIATFSTPVTSSTPTSKGGTFSISSPLTFNTTGLNTGTSLTTTLSSTVSTAATTPTFNFGASSATTPGALSFGVATTSTTTIPSVTGSNLPPTLSFGVQPVGISIVTTTSTAVTTTTTSSSGFTFTQPSTTSTLTFGAPKTTANFTFGTSTTTKSLTFNLGASTTTTSSTLGTGLFGTQKTDSLTITTTTTSVGLGGIDKAQTTQGLSGSGTIEPNQAKDHILPDPILQTLNDFQNFTKQQKSISVEISHGSSKPLKKVQEDLEAIESLIMTITSGLTKNAIAVDKLKTETAQGLHQAEMAQRNHETPPGLDYDNSEPSDYFNDLVTKFETDTVRLKVQMEASEKHLTSLTQCSTISPQELTLAMRRLHETLIVLAARVQALHTTVQSQKEQFKNLRRVYLKDDTNIFESESDQSKMKKKMLYSLRSLTGPTPFSETPGVGHPLNVDGLAMLASSTPVPNTSSNPSTIPPWQKSTKLGLPTPIKMCTFQNPSILEFKSNTLSAGNKRSKR